MRRRLSSLAERLAELDAKPGMGDDAWAKQKAVAERRMALVDAAPEAWRALLNAYPHSEVARVAAAGYDADGARRVLELTWQKPV